MKPTTGVRILDERTQQERDRAFLPGAGKTWLLPFYDAFARVAGVRPLYERTVELAGVEPGQAVIDVGCGTGNLSLSLLAAQPRARVTGLDPDAAALHRAARKARRKGVALTLVQGYADRIPEEDASADHVVSSLALHHVDDDGRAAFGREALRVLRPGGKVTVTDFGGPSSNVEDYLPEHDHGHGLRRVLRHLPRLMRSRVAHSPVVARNHGNGIVALLAATGFEDAGEVAHVDHKFGRITFVQATRR